MLSYLSENLRDCHVASLLAMTCVFLMLAMIHGIAPQAFPSVTTGLAALAMTCVSFGVSEKPRDCHVASLLAMTCVFLMLAMIHGIATGLAALAMTCVSFGVSEKPRDCHGPDGPRNDVVLFQIILP